MLMPRMYLNYAEAAKAKAETRKKAKEKRAELNTAYHITISKSDVLYGAFEKAVSESGSSYAGFLRVAITEKLRRDGYLTDDDVTRAEKKTK